MGSNLRPEYQDVEYGVASAAITSTGLIVVATTGAKYHGISMIAKSTQVSIIVYDNATGTSGNLLDTMIIRMGGDRQGERTIPVIAKNGITLGVTGSQGEGVVFYGPKG